jgi:hypothetical protein
VFWSLVVSTIISSLWVFKTRGPATHRSTDLGGDTGVLRSRPVTSNSVEGLLDPPFNPSDRCPNLLGLSAPNTSVESSLLPLLPLRSVPLKGTEAEPKVPAEVDLGPSQLEVDDRFVSFGDNVRADSVPLSVPRGSVSPLATRVLRRGEGARTRRRVGLG